jgi:hypothetical protein
MKVTSPIAPMLRDEHVLAIDPPPLSVNRQTWRKRINPVTGRSLSAKDLTTGQNHAALTQSLLARTLTPGIVRGLTVTLKPSAAGQRICIAPGLALTHSGEDVEISRAIEIDIADLAVCLPVDHLRKWHGATFALSAADMQALSFRPLPLKLPGDFGVLQDRAMGPRFGAPGFRPSIATLPRAAVLVAEPVTLDAVVPAFARDEKEAFAADIRDEPFEDRRLIDGVRLVLYLWPGDLRAPAASLAPDYTFPDPASPAFRNQLAHAVFSVERSFQPGDAHPWEQLGTPLALLAFDADWGVRFIDRACVARMGGLPRPRTQLVRHAGEPGLWQMRISQFLEQMLDEGAFDTEIAAPLAERLPRVPPVGLLPRSILRTQPLGQDFFPSAFDVVFTPVPLEQLELAVRESASLKPLSLAEPEPVEVLIPVPERLYDPGLLETAELDQALQGDVDQLGTTRDLWQARRGAARNRYSILAQSLSGELPQWPAREADEGEGEDRLPFGIDRFRSFAPGTRHRLVMAAESALTLQSGDRVFLWVRTSESVAQVTITTPTAGTILSRTGTPGPLLPKETGWMRLELPAEDLMDQQQRLAKTAAVTSVTFQYDGGRLDLGPMGRVSRDGQETVWISDDAPLGLSTAASGSDSVAGATAKDWTWASATSEGGDGPFHGSSDFGTSRSGAGNARRSDALTKLQDDLKAFPFLGATPDTIELRGLDRFISQTEQDLGRANDLVDKGFLRCRTDIIRIRQMMLGEADASKLATSSVMAGLVGRGDSAYTVNQKLTDYIKAAKTELKVAAGTGAADNTPVLSGTSGLRAGFSVEKRAVSVKMMKSTEVMARPMATEMATGQRLGADFAGEFKIASPVRGETARIVERLAFRNNARDAILDQSFMPGIVDRNITVAERLAEPEAVTTQRSALAARQQLVTELAMLHRKGFVLGDITIPGAVKTPATGTAAAVLYTIKDADILSGDKRKDLDDKLSSGPPVVGTHEVAYFQAALAILEDAVAMLRFVEARIGQYRQIVQRAKETQAIIVQALREADLALASIAIELAEARHDVAVGTALLEEEQKRIEDLKARRKDIIASHVPFLLYRRQRWANRVTVMPTQPVSPATDAAPDLTCLSDHADAPADLQAMAVTFRNAPASWFPALRTALDGLDKAASVRAAVMAVDATRPEYRTISSAVPEQGRAIAAAYKVISAQRNMLAGRRKTSITPRAELIDTLGLKEVRRIYGETATVHDLANGGHGKPEISRQATALIQRLAQLAGCLHANLCGVPARVRLDWAEALSVFDEPMDLRRLNMLRGWQKLSADMRREQQGLVEALHRLVDPGMAEAATAINELIRVAVLLASHAPAGQLISARALQTVRPAPGRLIGLRLDMTAVRIGMDVVMRSPAGGMLARATVVDMMGMVAQAEITAVLRADVQVTPETIIHVSDRLNKSKASMTPLRLPR